MNPYIGHIFKTAYVLTDLDTGRIIPRYTELVILKVVSELDITSKGYGHILPAGTELIVRKAHQFVGRAKRS